MEQLNRVELRGVVGNVKFQSTEGRPSVIFTMVTNRAYHDRSGAAVIETTWHNVIAHESRDITDLGSLQKGARVYVAGRLRNQKYTGPDGVERFGVDIIANRLALVDQDEILGTEM